jgi:ATP-dependent Lon protease
MSLDEKIQEHFAGLIVRKDLSNLVRGNALVPTYVLEYLLGQYCATNDSDSILSGIETVKNILARHYVNRNESELVKSTIREEGRYKIIDKISVQLNDKNDTYEASFGNLGIKKVIVDREYIKEHPKLLVGGVWCILDIEYLHEDDQNHSPWIIDTLKPIQISNVDFDVFKELRKEFNKEEWIDLIVQSLGFNPEELGDRNKMYQLVRLISYCENNFNLIELGPKGTGKSHIFSEFSPHGILVSGGEITLAKLFVNNSNGRLGLLGYWDVVALDEFAGKGKKADKTLIDVMKNYMANHSFSRGTDQITADASMVFVGNTSKSVSYLLKQATLFDDLPLLYQDSAFLDRIHYYIPGWEVSIIRNEMFSNEFGFIVDYLAQILKLMRFQDYSDLYRDWFELDKSLSTRDRTGINKTFSGLMKIIYPHKVISKEDAEELLRFAMEGRKRVKLELYKLDSTYDPVFFRYKDLSTGETMEVLTHEETKYHNFFQKFHDETKPGDPGSKKVVVKIRKPPGNEPLQEERKSESATPENKHISIQENDTGVSYGRLFAEYLLGAHRIEIQDPYIRKIFQIRNLMEFIQVVVSTKEDGEEVSLHLVTATGDIRMNEIEPHLRDIADQLINVDIKFTYEFNESIHDKHITTDTGWNIIPGRGLDIYQRWDRGALGLEQFSPESRLTRAFDVSYFRDGIN